MSETQANLKAVFVKVCWSLGSAPRTEVMTAPVCTRSNSQDEVGSAAMEDPVKTIVRDDAPNEKQRIDSVGIVPLRDLTSLLADASSNHRLTGWPSITLGATPRKRGKLALACTTVKAGATQHEQNAVRLD